MEEYNLLIELLETELKSANSLLLRYGIITKSQFKCNLDKIEYEINNLKKRFKK